MSRWIFWTVLILVIILLVLAGWDLCKGEVSKKHNDVPLASKDAVDNTFFVHVFVHDDRKETNQCGPCGKKKSAHKKLKHKDTKQVPRTESKKEEPVKVLASTPDFYEKAVMPKSWSTEPEEEVTPETPPKRGNKIYVIRQTPPAQYYGGGGYYGGNVTYGQQYVPPPQTVFVPAPQVIVPAPSVVTPAGGYSPQGSTGGHGPAGTTGAAL